MEECQHSWSVIGHSTGPRPILFLQCMNCGIESRLFPTADEWAGYLNWCAEGGARWVAWHLGQPDPYGETPAADSDILIDETTDGIHLELRETALGRQQRLARLIDSLDLFDEGDDVPF